MSSRGASAALAKAARPRVGHVAIFERRQRHHTPIPRRQAAAGGLRLDDASDGSAALAKMNEKKYGLVISDWNMEPMTGYDLLKEVRADPNLATTPFIMITAESKTENVIAAKKAGVNNYIVKPFNAATLKTKIEAVFPDMASA